MDSAEMDEEDSMIWKKDLQLKKLDTTMNDNKTIQPEERTSMLKQHKYEELPCIGQRHVVVVLLFFSAAFVTGQRLVMSVAIVKMVNHTAVVDIKLQMSSNVTTCPKPNITNVVEKYENSVGEFNWDSQMQGVILGIISLGLFVTLLPAGRLAEEWGAKNVMVISNFLGALVCIVTPFAAWWNPYALIVFQFFRGMSQGFVLPTTYVMMANWYPPKERILFAPWLGFGFPFGGVVVSSISGYICDLPNLGWPWPFYLVGGANLLFALLLLILYFETPQSHPRISEAERKYITTSLECDMSKKRPPMPWKSAFTSVPLYALMIAYFGFNWQMMYFMTVHPLYLGTVLHYSMTKNGLINSLPMFSSVLGGFCSSIICNYLAQRDCFSKAVIRKGCHVIGCLGFSICILSVIAAGCDLVPNFVAFLIASFMGGIPFATMSTAPVELTPIFAGTIMGFVSALSIFASFFLPIVVGALAKNELPSEWNNLFIISACICTFCAIVFVVFGSVNIQQWNFVRQDIEEKSNATKSAYCKTEKITSI